MMTILRRPPTAQLIHDITPYTFNLLVPRCIPCISRRIHAVPAPSTRRAQARRDGQFSGTAGINKDVFLPSLSLLRSAKTSGAITIEPDHVLRFITAYVALGRDASPSRVERLCREQNLPPSNLPHIATTLLRSTRPPHHALAKHILLASSKLGIPEATYFLVFEGLKRDRLSESQLQPAVTHLSRLASSTGTDFRALVLWGQVLLSKGQEKQAMKIFQRAIDEDPTTDKVNENKEQTSLVQISKSKAYTVLASYYLKTNDMSLAQSLSRQAAERYDDMEAWLCLAKTQPADSPEKENSLTHAAAKGSLEAANELGEYFLRRSRLDSDGDDKEGKGERGKRQDWMWAKEWFSLGVHEGVPRGQEEMKRLLA